MARLKGGAVVEIQTAVGPPIVWTAVTCQVVEARTSIGASRSRGVLTQADAGPIELTLYDPTRLLDPNNASSPYKAVLKAGLPIRFSFDDGTRTLIKEGYVDSLEHDLTSHEGRIRANDWVAWASNYQYPNATVGGQPYSPSETFNEYMQAMIVNINNVDPFGKLKVPFTIHNETGVIWIHAEPVGNAGETGKSVWDFITGFCEAYLYTAWMQGNVVRASDALVHHGPRVTVGCGGLLLTGFESRIDAAGVVNRVRLTYGAGAYSKHHLESIFRWGEKTFTPGALVPLRGRFYTGAGADDLDNWANPVLNDRAEPSLEAVPLRILPQSAAELRALLALTPMQQVYMTATTPPISIYGRWVGSEVGVTPEGWEVKLVTYIKAGDTPLPLDESLVFEAEAA